ncbi:protocatechuate 3,4-dioxygenase subunit alpha [Streptomyces sp. NPDC058426]|uniref:protocatechuate 3,4-dioxygenase subunit alpha n=1 Tax=Streptomyces sp. NPDC058426 TaxID=3346493 RepID=UPI0036541F83
MTAPHPTPSQTVGPFYGYALPFPGGDDLAPGDPRALTLHGTVRDGSGAPIPDALLEFWQAAPDNSRTGATGSMRRDPVDGRVIGRDGTRFTGFGRVPTDADGHYALRTLPPPPEAPYLGVLVLARGLLHHLHTRAYLPGHPHDTLLAGLPPERRATLLAHEERAKLYRFDIRLQGDDTEETVFLDFP